MPPPKKNPIFFSRYARKKQKKTPQSTKHPPQKKTKTPKKKQKNTPKKCFPWRAKQTSRVKKNISHPTKKWNETQKQIPLCKRPSIPRTEIQPACQPEPEGP